MARIVVEQTVELLMEECEARLGQIVREALMDAMEGQQRIIRSEAHSAMRSALADAQGGSW